jgi:4-amino-4-deoxy-L-arabinose transferase-like glycosyltransferase
MSKITKILLVLILAFELGVQLYLAKSDSQTTDEAVHVSAGYTYLTKGDFRFNPEHPPLVKLLSAIPLVFMDLKVPDDSKYWDRAEEFYYDSWLENRQYGEEFFYKIGNDANKMLFLSRLGPIFLTLTLGVLIFFIVYKYWKEKAAIIALILYCFNPIVIAHGHLVTTDIGVSLGFVLTVYGLSELIKKRSFSNFLIFVLGLSVAFLSKFTAVILIPCILVALIYQLLFLKKLDKKSFWGICGWILVSFIVVALIIFACYGFDYKIAGDMKSFKQALSNNPAYNPSLGNLLDKLNSVRYVLVPKYFFKGISLVIGHTQIGHSAYLLGMSSKTGWWYYFPIVFLVKNSVFFIILFTFSIYFSVKSKDKNGFSQILLVFGIVYFLFAMTSKANLGVRHILPFIVLLCIYISRIILVKDAKKKFLIWTMVTIIALESIFVFPYYMSYFNPLFGGRKKGYQVASDSNSDWGQDLKRIKSFIDKNETEISKCTKLYVSYGWNGEAALDYYKISRSPLTELTISTKGCIIISTSAYVMDENSWLRKFKIEKITPSAFFIRTY